MTNPSPRQSIPSEMRAAFIERTGGPEEITVGTLPVPSLGPTDVLVRFAASEVNHVDTFVRSGAYPTPLPMPFVIGRDVVGTVAAVGQGVSSFRPGDRVWCNSLGHGGRQGAFAEYAAVAAARLYHLPAGVDFLDAASVLHGAGTAHVGLVREAGLRPGETVFIGGGTGTVGSAAVQLAAAMGARVIASCGPGDMDYCRSLGADHVIDYHDPEMHAKVGEAAGRATGDGRGDGKAGRGVGLDVWWDTSGHQDLRAQMPLMRSGGRVLITAGLAATVNLPVGPLYTGDVSVRGFAISNASVADLASAAVAINDLLARGRLTGRVGATMGLAEARQAHEAMEHGRVTGRIVIVA